MIHNEAHDRFIGPRGPLPQVTDRTRQAVLDALRLDPTRKVRWMPTNVVAKRAGVSEGTARRALEYLYRTGQVAFDRTWGSTMRGRVMVWQRTDAETRATLVEMDRVEREARSAEDAKREEAERCLRALGIEFETLHDDFVLDASAVLQLRDRAVALMTEGTNPAEVDRG